MSDAQDQERIEALEAQVRTLVDVTRAHYKQIAELEVELAKVKAENDRLSGKACLVCGRTEPCTDAPDACTFDPDPITAAKQFLERAWKAEAERDAAVALLDSIRCDIQCAHWHKDIDAALRRK